ncbi:MAG: 7TM diverse intracellular signaling domain-containing protein [Ferruginibacter sp.]
METFKLINPYWNSIIRQFILLITLLIFSGQVSGQSTINDSGYYFKSDQIPAALIDTLYPEKIPFKLIPEKRVVTNLAENEYHYLLLKLSSATEIKDAVLSIDNTSLDTVNIYKLEKDRSAKLLYQGGALMPYTKSRNYTWHTAKLDIDNTPSFYLIAMKSALKNINTRYEILPAPVLQKKYEVYQRFVYFYLGISAVIAFVILLTFYLFKEPVFGAYLGYVVCTSGWILTHYGIIFPLLHPQIPMINEVIKPLTSLGSSVFLTKVLSMVFAEQLEKEKWLRVLLRFSIYILVTLTIAILLLLTPIVPKLVKLTLVIAWQLALYLSIVAIVFTPIYLIRSGYIARVFSIAVSILTGMVIVQQLANLGFIHSFFINEHGMMLASLLDVTIMTLGLFHTFLHEKRTRDKQLIELERDRNETLKKLITVQDYERERIAADLHDNLGPLLAALKINFRRIINTGENLHEELVGKTESIIDDSIAEIRNVAHNLMPKGLSSNGLVNTLNEYFESIEQLYQKRLLFKHDINTTINADMQTNLYRIICELVLNAARHSKAVCINICIQTTEHYITVTISDDGQGFPKKAKQRGDSLGLHSAESRVRYMKGTFSLVSAQKTGTLIDIEIPL